MTLPRSFLGSVALLVAFVVALPPASHAQFEEVDVQLGYTQNVNRILLHDYWEPGWGPQLAVNTPFYFGYAEGVVAYHIYETRVDDVPPFNALMLQVGWGVRTEPVSWLRLEAGLRVGNYGMQFRAEDGRERGELNQSELNMAVQTRASVRLFGPVALHASTSYQRTYVHHRMDLVYVSFGISGRFSTPSWFQEFLR